ncbi:MAG: hypothetical protein HY236_15540 [Acidobacteria bacterium]|nr:hypothetical protein [Acidobacteriota bacterium]
MLLGFTLRLLAATLGAGLQLFLAVLLGRKKGAGLVERVALAAAAVVGLWHAANAIALFHRATSGHESLLLLAALNQVAIVGLALAPSVLLHLGLLWAGIRKWLAAAPVYAAIPIAWWALESGSAKAYAGWWATSLAATAALCFYAGRRATTTGDRRFFSCFALALLVVLAGGVAEAGSATVTLAALAPPLAFTYFVYRYNFLGLLLSRRIVFALKMGIVFAIYLFLVRRVAGFVEEEFEAFGRLVEVALIFAAAMVWLPLYGWMSRFLSKRTTLYAAFSKHLIEEAAGILDLRHRVQFLAEEVGRTFRVHRALLITSGEATLLGEFGPRNHDHQAAWSGLRKLLALARHRHADVVHAATTDDAEFRQLLSSLGFNYLFPLWYEDRLNGLLLLDTAPRLFLDEDEAMLLGLSRQISHSVETARVIEEKIGLERTLAKQEHLATLGKVAATIAHEVKNPLSSIKTLAQLLREDPEVERRYARDLTYILTEVDRLNRTVQQLLSFSRPAPEPEAEVNLSELLEVTAEALARQYEGEQIRITHRIEPRLRLKLASTEAVKQVVLNLTLNAAQASAPNTSILMEAGAIPGGKICIAVSDQGPGIPPELRERIFEPFFTTKQKGTGLGLAIVRKNVRQLGGEIQVESPLADGHGTRVAVTLPAQ